VGWPSWRERGRARESEGDYEGRMQGEGVSSESKGRRARARARLIAREGCMQGIAVIDGYKFNCKNPHLVTYKIGRIGRESR
jgi:hypothetical protein